MGGPGDSAGLLGTSTIDYGEADPNPKLGKRGVRKWRLVKAFHDRRARACDKARMGMTALISCPSLVSRRVISQSMTGGANHTYDRGKWYHRASYFISELRILLLCRFPLKGLTLSQVFVEGSHRPKHDWRSATYV